MLSALAGADALEILVILKDMSAAGLKNVESNIARVEGKANGANFSGFSSKTKTLTTDAEKAAGKAEGGGGGMGNMISSALGIPGPLLIAGAAVGIFAGLAATTIPVYEKTQEELKATTAAAKAHGISMDELTVVTQKATDAGISFGIGTDDVRQSVEKMTLAGIAAADQQAAMPAIMDLSIAKNLSMADATEVVVKAMMGQTKGLKDLGIILPTVSTKAADVAGATSKLAVAQQNSTVATQELTIEENKLKGVHHLTAAEALALEKAHNKAQDAATKLKAAQAALTLAQQGGVDKGKQLDAVIKGITGSTGDQSGTVSDLKQNQTKLSDAWDKFSNAVAPAVTAALTAVIGALSRIVGWLADMFDWLGKIFSISNTGAANLAKIQSSGTPTSNNRGMLPIGYGSHAEGGWVGQRGPGLALVGEKGPEYISPTPSPMGMGGGGHITININTTWPPTTEQAKQIAQTVAKHLARNLNVAPKTTRPYGSL